MIDNSPWVNYSLQSEWVPNPDFTSASNRQAIRICEHLAFEGGTCLEIDAGMELSGGQKQQKVTKMRHVVKMNMASLSESGPKVHRLYDIQIGVGGGLVVDYTYCADDGCALSMCLELAYQNAHAMYVCTSVSERACFERECIINRYQILYHMLGTQD